MASKIYSDHTTIDKTITLDGIDVGFNHTFASIMYFSEAGLINEVIPTDGTIVITGRPNGASGYGLFDNSTIDCTDTSAYASSNATVNSVRATPDSIAGATHYQLTVTSRSE